MNDIQTMLADSARAVFDDTITPALQQHAEAGVFAESLWTQLVGQGFTQAVLDEAAGGSGLSWADVYPLVHAAGRHAAPVPLVETMLAHQLLVRAGCASAPPEAVLSVAFVQADQLRATDDGSPCAQAVLTQVPYARHAQRLILNSDVQGVPHVGWIDLCDASAIEPGLNIAREPRDTVSLNGVSIQDWRPAPQVGRAAVLRHGAMLRAAQMAGAVERLLEQSLAYANERSQFGRSLSRFQVIQHHLAELGCEAAAMASGAAYAFERRDHGMADLEIAAAKIRAGRAAGHAASLAHAVHGAIGFSYEHTLHYASRRLWSWRSEYGSHGWWSQRLGQAVCAQGPDGWWPIATGGLVSMETERETLA